MDHRYKPYLSSWCNSQFQCREISEVRRARACQAKNNRQRHSTFRQDLSSWSKKKKSILDSYSAVSRYSPQLLLRAVSLHYRWLHPSQHNICHHNSSFSSDYHSGQVVQEKRRLFLSVEETTTTPHVYSSTSVDQSSLIP
jgi:hypothetical protein